MEINKYTTINSVHLGFLSPLNKWRILDLKALRQDAQYNLHPTSFEKCIRRLEKSKIVASFRDPWSRKKFVYLTTTGEKLVSVDNLKCAISTETIIHDAKVTEIGREMMLSDYMSDCHLEHEIKADQTKEVPDAEFKGKKTGKKFNMAFELELTRKSKDRIHHKIQKYLDTNYYDYVLYMFCTESIYRGYKKFIMEEFGEEASKKIMLFWNPTIFSKEIKLRESQGYFKSKEVNFTEVFG